MKKPLKLRCIVSLFAAIVLLTGFGGYHLRGWRDAARISLTRDQLAGLDFYFAPQSFSEVEHARAVLDALAHRYRDEVLTLRNRSVKTKPSGGAVVDSASQADNVRIINLLEKGVEEFRGTEQQSELVRLLLSALKREKLYDRWTDVYLHTLYEHPTHAFVGQFAAEAIQVSELADRQAEILTAFRHVCDIPMDFTAKHQVETVRLMANTKAQLSWYNRDSL